MQNQVISLFDMTRNVFGDVPTLRCSKATLVHISHVLEDTVLKNEIPALMFTGFQESSHWRKETERYRKLADVAQQVCIFAGKPLPQAAAASAIQVELAGDDPLRQEWFVIILARDFSVVLCGKDRVVPVAEEAWRDFETILSFEPEVITSVLDGLEGVLRYYRPELVGRLQAARRQHTPLQMNPRLMTHVINEMLGFEEKLNRELQRENEQTHLLNRALQKERDFVKTLLTSSPTYVVATTIDGQTIFMNLQLIQLLAIDPIDEMLLTNFWDDYIVDNEQAWIRERHADLETTQDVTTFNARLNTPSGFIPMEWHSTLIRDEQDTPKFIISIGLDITERLRARKAIEQEARVRAELESERALHQLHHQFMTTISHEFRTPLAIILSSAEMIDRYSDRLTADRRQSRVMNIKKQVYLLTEMIEDMTTILHINKGKENFEPQAVDLHNIIQGIAHDVQMMSNHDLRVAYGEISGKIRADVTLITHILMNLLRNAIRYSPEDQAIILRLDRTDTMLTFIVQDFGAGIPEADHPYLYEAFYRGGNAGNIPGAGLGLRIVRDAVQAYDGTVSFKTSAEGTTFTVRLPLPS